MEVLTVTWDELLASVMISDNNTLGIMQITSALILPFLLTFPIVFVYRSVQKNNNFSSSFIMTLFLFASLSSTVTMLIGNNIARAFGLVGALSIIRFRTALKDPLDAVFIFWALCMGMAAGTGYYLLAVSTVVLCSAMLIIVKGTGIATPRFYDSVLKVVVNNKNEDVTKNVESSLKKSIGSYQKINEYFDSKEDFKTYVYTLKRPRKTNTKIMEESLRKLEGVESIAHLNKESSLFLESKH
jgi:uncharacterized membrane protein YhiD involved in acid resistance